MSHRTSARANVKDDAINAVSHFSIAVTRPAAAAEAQQLAADLPMKEGGTPAVEGACLLASLHAGVATGWLGQCSRAEASVRTAQLMSGSLVEWPYVRGPETRASNAQTVKASNLHAHPTQTKTGKHTLSTFVFRDT